MGNHVLESGASRSEKARGFHQIPTTAIEREAARFDLGGTAHGEYNWQKGVDDPAWVKECWNHVLQHLLDWRSGKHPDDDHLAAVRCGAAFLMVTEERCPEALREAFRDI